MKISPSALAAGPYKKIRLADLSRENADEAFIYRYPPPEGSIDEINGDGDLLEIEDYGVDAGLSWVEAGGRHHELTPDTVVYIRVPHDYQKYSPRLPTPEEAEDLAFSFATLVWKEGHRYAAESGVLPPIPSEQAEKYRRELLNACIVMIDDWHEPVKTGHIYGQPYVGVLAVVGFRGTNVVLRFKKLGTVFVPVSVS